MGLSDCRVEAYPTSKRQGASTSTSWDSCPARRKTKPPDYPCARTAINVYLSAENGRSPATLAGGSNYREELPSAADRDVEVLAKCCLERRPPFVLAAAEIALGYAAAVAVSSRLSARRISRETCICE